MWKIGRIFNELAEIIDIYPIRSGLVTGVALAGAFVYGNSSTQNDVFEEVPYRRSGFEERLLEESHSELPETRAKPYDYAYEGENISPGRVFDFRGDVLLRDKNRIDTYTELYE